MSGVPVDLLTRPLTNADEAIAWIRAMYAAGFGTHPDDRAADVVKAGGVPLFSEVEAPLVDARMDEVFAHVEDPYIHALAAADPANADPFADGEIRRLASGEVAVIEPLDGGGWVVVVWGSEEDYLADREAGSGDRATASVAVDTYDEAIEEVR